MATKSTALGIDFGTSNSAAGFMRDGRPHLVTFANGQTTLPTTFFFDYDTRKTLLGEPANRALLAGEEGRFMRALKRVLGTTLMHEKRQILNQRVTFVEIIARFLNHIKIQAEAETGLTFDRVLSGRPVVFHGTNDPREAQAQEDLRACYLAAGFSDVAFMDEPEAAAIASGALENTGETGLIVDIGGGTSDFSLFKTSSTGVEILANHGVRIGGTDFDRALSFSQVMPLFGRDTLLRNAIGDGTLPAPNAIFHDLATWEKIPFLYTAQTRRMVADMHRQAQEPAKIGRLVSVLQDELGHELAFEVERGKIAANNGEAAPSINLQELESGLILPLASDVLDDVLAAHTANLRQGALDVLNMAGLGASQVDRIVYVGGSSLLKVVSGTMADIFPQAQHTVSEVFTAVTDGLALAAEHH